MRRKVGVSVVRKKQDETKHFGEVAKNLEATKLSAVKEVLNNFQTTLAEFASKHKQKIISDPEFRQQFHTMCVSAGVDPLASSKGFWSDILGVGDFYFELGVKIIQISVKTRSRNGGIMSLEEMLRYMKKLCNVAVSAEDIKRAVNKLTVLGNGFRLINIAGSPMICSVPIELNMDHERLLAAAQSSGGFISAEQILTSFHWTRERFNVVMNPLLAESMAWIDIHNGVTTYHFPSLWKP